MLLLTMMFCVYVSGERTSHFRGCLIGSDMCQPISYFDVLPPRSRVVESLTIFNFFVGIIQRLICANQKDTSIYYDDHDHIDHNEFAEDKISN